MYFQYKFGFKKGHSISHAIITLDERVSKALDTGKYVAWVFLHINSISIQNYT